MSEKVLHLLLGVDTGEPRPSHPRLGCSAPERSPPRFGEGTIFIRFRWFSLLSLDDCVATCACEEEFLVGDSTFQTWRLGGIFTSKNRSSLDTTKR
ncbi:hypothetical protein ACHAW5_001358 [Stephanodiscus triporus]|uniref:Uncharacterized protein n=1 Tax=Stephanodiscus triporus TaxID=2934178 RepID=A0ABD3MQC3_9STRA